MEMLNQQYMIRRAAITQQMQTSAEEKGTKKMAIDPKPNNHVSCDY